MRGKILRKLILGAALSFSSPLQAAAPMVSSIPQTRPNLTSAAPMVSSIPRVRPTATKLARERSIETTPNIDTAELILAMGQRPKTAARQCRNDALVGESIRRIPGELPGCGVKEPVRLTSVHGIQLSRAAIMDCRTADAFAIWIDKTVAPEFKKVRRQVEVIDVVASYDCRTRNNQPGAKISEHGKGRAVDVGSFVLDNGQRVSVFVDWNSDAFRNTVRALHKGACGPFSTVLGPEADRFHEDHIHMDTARRNSGSYCR